MDRPESWRARRGLLAGALLIGFALAVPQAARAQNVQWCHDYTKVSLLRHTTGSAPDSVRTPLSELKALLAKQGYAECPGCEDDLQFGDVVIFGVSHSGFVNRNGRVDNLAIEAKSNLEQVIRAVWTYEQDPKLYSNFYADQSLSQVLLIERDDRKVVTYEQTEEPAFDVSLRRYAVNYDEVTREIARQKKLIEEHWPHIYRFGRAKEEVRYIMTYNPYKDLPVHVWRLKSKMKIKARLDSGHDPGGSGSVAGSACRWHKVESMSYWPNYACRCGDREVHRDPRRECGSRPYPKIK